MNKSVSSKELWNRASTTGLLLAIVTILFSLVASLFDKINSPVLSGVMGVLLEIGKITACILLFRTFMVKLKLLYPDADRRTLKNYGLRITLCSSLIVAAFNLIDVLYIHPDMISQMMEQFREAYSQFADSNTLAALERFEGKMPVYTFFTSWIYCFIWGWILSLIYSSTLTPSNPFKGMDEDSDEK